MELIKILVLIIVSYLLGSFPFGYLLVKLFKKKDVRQNGTGNIGATNTLIVGGKILGIMTLILDFLKGSAVIVLVRFFTGSDAAIILSALAVIAGHDFSLFLRFKGGKGIATSAGAMFMIDPILVIVCILLYVLVLIVTRYVIISTILVLSFLPVMMWMASYNLNYILFGLAIFLLAFYAHRLDIKRFLAGEEVKINEARQKYS